MAEVNPMICEILHDLNADGTLKAAALASILGIGTSCAYAHLHETALSLEQFRRLIALAPEPAARRLLEYLVYGTKWRLERSGANADLNGDNRVDGADLQAGELAELDTLNRIMQRVQKWASTGMSALDRETATALRADLVRMRELADSLLAAAAKLESGPSVLRRVGT